MTNHITTEITGPPAIIEHLTRARTEEEITAAYDDANSAATIHINYGFRGYRPNTALGLSREIDFNLLIPQPENIETGWCSGYHAPGVICWYEWNSQHWGTKWNGYNLYITQKDDGNVTLRFNTARNHPHTIIEALSRAVGDTALIVRYADEDLGYNLGDYTIRNGDVEDSVPMTNGSDEASEFAAQLIYNTTYAEWHQD